MPRMYLPNVSLHVYNRGNNRTSIFAEDIDCEVFLRMLKSATAWHDVAVHEYMLMTNHFHLIATPSTETAMAGAMKQVGERYSRYFNRRHHRTGRLWERPYQGKHLMEERQWLICARYIAQNPVRARMVLAPGDHQWSSYRVHALDEESDWLVPHAVYLGLGSNDEERQSAFRALCNEPLPEADLVCIRNHWVMPAPADAFAGV
jgi:putative transposase